MRVADPQISFADLEFLSQGIQLDPVLEQILELVTRNAVLVETVRQQLDDGLKKPQTGRSGLNAEQTILSLILMRVKNWDYRELAERIADGYTLRQFTRFYSKPVPKHDAFNGAHNRLTPVILEKINNLVVAAISCGSAPMAAGCAVAWARPFQMLAIPPCPRPVWPVEIRWVAE